MLDCFINELTMKMRIWYDEGGYITINSLFSFNIYYCVVWFVFVNIYNLYLCIYKAKYSLDLLIKTNLFMQNIHILISGLNNKSNQRIHISKSNFNIKRLIILNSWHYWTHKLQKYYQRHMRFNFLSFSFRFFHKSFHHIRMLTRMNCQHSNIKIRHSLFSYCLVLILSIYVFKYLLWSKRSSINIIAFYP